MCQVVHFAEEFACVCESRVVYSVENLFFRKKKPKKQNKTKTKQKRFHLTL